MSIEIKSSIKFRKIESSISTSETRVNDSKRFKIEMVVGKGDVTTTDLQNCVYIDNKLKRAVFDCCSKLIFRKIFLTLDRDKCGDAVLLRRIKGTTARSLDERYFRRFNSKFSVTSYCFDPTSFVVEISAGRCAAIYREIIGLVVSDLRTQWPRERISLKVQKVLKDDFPDIDRLFMSVKRLCMDKIQKTAENEGWGEFEQRESGIFLVWERFFERDFSKQNSRQFSAAREEFRAMKAAKEKSITEAELSVQFVPSVDDW